jgi:heme exporter protein D
MNWESWQQFIHMRGYGTYVWGSFAVTFIFMTVEVLGLRRREKLITLSRMSRHPSSETS